MTTILRPQSFPCPACSDPIFDRWYPGEYSYNDEAVPIQEFWSDNVVTGSWNEIRSIVACPVCSAVFPYFAVKVIKEKSYSEEKGHLAANTPFLHTLVSWQGCSEEDFENVVEEPDVTQWRISSGHIAQEKNNDFLFNALLAESIIQTFNDHVRDQVRAGTQVFGVAKEEELIDFLRTFSEQAQDDGAETAWSDWAGRETWEFMGITRYNLLVAEVDRYLGNFDKALDRLTMIHNHVIEMMEMIDDDEEEVNGVDYSKEYDDEKSIYNWGVEETLARIVNMLNRVEKGDSSLVLVHSEPLPISQIGRMFF
jgi:hypothetical protein